MSETEHKKGTMKPTGKTIEEYMADVKIPDYYSSKSDYFNDEMYESAVCIDGFVFEIKCSNVDVFGDIAIAEINQDGSIDFEIKWYNGGASMADMIGEALSKIGKKIK